MQPGDLDNAVIAFQHGFIHAMAPLMNAAMDLAYGLALVSLLVSVLLMLLRGETFSKAMSNLFYLGVMFGLFFTGISLVGSWVPEWVNGFMETGGQAAGITGLDPSSIISDGLYIGGTLIKAAYHTGLFHTSTMLWSLIVGSFVVIIYAFIAADLAVVLVKSYALVAIGPIVFALGPLEMTRPSVVNYVKKVLGIGINLMMLYIVVGVGITMSKGWVNDIQTYAHSKIPNFNAILTILAGIILLYLIVKNVPAFIAELSGVGGFRNYGDAAVGAAAGAAALGAKALASPAKAAQGAMAVAGGMANAAHYGGRAGMFLGQALGAGMTSGVTSAVKTGNLTNALASGMVQGGKPFAQLMKNAGSMALNRVVQGPPKK